MKNTGSWDGSIMGNNDVSEDSGGTCEMCRSCSEGPTLKNQILELSKHNPILYRSIKTGDVNGLDWEHTMMLAVKHLVEVNDQNVKALIKFSNLHGLSEYEKIVND